MSHKKLNFKPLPGLSSKHLQTILQVYCPTPSTVPSQRLLVQVDEKSHLSCEITTPSSWSPLKQTIALVHGLGGSHNSHYMARLTTKFHGEGKQVVRINLRGCGSGKGLSHRPYNASTSHDILKVLDVLKTQAPQSEITAIGFSLGGSILLKLASELGDQASTYVKTFITICAPLDLFQTCHQVEKKRHRLYHKYFLKNMFKQAPDWVNKRAKSMYEFDHSITAPLWGYENAHDYYTKCSGAQFLATIQQETHVLMTEDDPFVPLKSIHELALSPHVKTWTTSHGGHMGFLGKTKNHGIYWIDDLLLNWTKGDFVSNCL